MKGSIIERGDSLQLRVSLGKNPSTGKYDTYTETFRGNRTQAAKRLRELLTELDKGSFVKPGKEKLADYLNSWLRDIASPNFSPHTYEGYEFSIHKYVIPALGQISLTELKPQHLQKLYAEKQAAGLNSTAQFIHKTIHRALENAVKTGILARNTADLVEPPKVPRHEMRILNENEMQLFLEFSKKNPYHALFYLALFSGMRRSEMLALRWQDVDLILGNVTVNRTMCHVRLGINKGKVIYKAPKTQKGRRLIPISPSTCEVLREHGASQNKQRQSLNLPEIADTDLVFAQWDGKPFQPNSITHAWIKLARKCGLDRIRLHDLRHTMASTWLKHGIHPKIVQERLGHSSIQITLDTYSHVLPGLQAAAANKIDDLILSNTIIQA